MSDDIDRVMRESAGEALARPHWLPEEAWLGVEIGKWPIQAFPTQETAARWAVGDRRRIFRVTIPANTETFEVEVVPATTRLKPTH